MSDRDWRGRGAFVTAGSLFLGAVIFSVILALWSGHALYDQITGDYSRHIEQDTQSNIADPIASDFQFWRDTFPQWAMAVFSIIATGVSAYAVKVVRDTFRETERTADAAVAANVASEKAALEARQSEERLNRAYIAVLPADIRVMESTDGLAYRWIGHVEISNVGRVPASNVRVHIHAGLSPDKDLKGLRQPDATESIGVLAPGVSVEQGSEPFVAEINRRGFAYVHGTVNYLDGFGNERWTRFCHRYACIMTEVHDSALPTFRGISAKYGRQHQYGNNAT